MTALTAPVPGAGPYPGGPDRYLDQDPRFLDPRPTEEPRPPTLPLEEAERLTRVIDAYLADQEGRLAISVHDLASGATYSYGPQTTFHTASLAKLNILVLLLLHAQDEGRVLAADERSLAADMIRYSDNDAADALYARIGFEEGLTEGNDRLGLHATEPGAHGVWGATRTTTADQLRLLRVVFTGRGPLSRSNRSYVRELMGSVAPEQAWGVSAAAGPVDAVALKNGWMPRDADGGRWTVNSSGHVLGADHEYLITVLSDHHLDSWTGIQCVEHVVAEVVAAIEDGPV
ncbi:serine hydrolase [Nocardiopsis ansamitocini]|uniref:Beta-lactamase class A catalytic domain-containing protein n=1 Tax=Nocardiopsis ansamitocini TaxID=1670832 RepID=A0A9W6P617_9ACTN|nr:serine hydrolase [Nocardiopsis ansamitocini]GLU47724.1 hypothetical protein Nans01_20750 [Nocardiopsis ansamitocini]